MLPTEVLIDTNLLLVLIVGSIDRELISRFKRTAAYSASDFDLLVSELSAFGRLVTTPTILAEASNHLGQLRSPARETARGQLKEMIGAWEEHYCASATVMDDVEYRRLGLTDIAICDAALTTRTVFTGDFDLYSLLSRRGALVVNFNHLRSAHFGL
jgi:hypothetical protein